MELSQQVEGVPARLPIESPNLSAKQIVKDGVWQVPPEKRPKNWQSMAVRESVETTRSTHESTKVVRETVVSVKEPEQPASTIIDVRPTEMPESTMEFDFIPKDSLELTKEAVESLVFTEVTDPDELPGDFDLCLDRRNAIGEELVIHRRSKVDVDKTLGLWIQRRKLALRHVGVRSDTIRDLFLTVHAMLVEERKLASHNLEREVRQARHGDKCECWYCIKDKEEAASR